MSARDSEEEGACILGLDNGGPGTYSQLVILKEYMTRLADSLGALEDDVYPADYFDLIGGVGFGGLVSLMLGHLGMSVAQAMDALATIALAVFGVESQGTPDPELNMINLKEAVEDLLQARGIPLDSKMYDPHRASTKCKVVLYSATSNYINRPQPFRTYFSRGSSLNPTFVEAVCATIAHPSFFSPVRIGPRLRQQAYIGGPLGANNPTRELLKEASSIFGPEKRVAQVISLGSGVPHILSLGSLTDDVGVRRLLKELAVDCQMVGQDLSTRLISVNAYLRLNVDKGMENLGMDDWSVLGDIEAHTQTYLGATSVMKDLEDSLRRLQGRVGTISLRRINNSGSIKVEAKMSPAVSPYYVKRPKESALMIHYLVESSSSRQKIFPITGMGGCGKTQMVSHFLQEHSSLYAHVVFIDASSSFTIKADFRAWASSLNDGEHEDAVWEDGLRLLAGIPNNQRWALILDNADDPKLKLAPFIPQNNGLTVIITSRNRNVGNLSTTYHLELGEMEDTLALMALLKAARRSLPLSPEELNSVHTLTRELGCLPVALVQAGTYCYELSSSVHSILQPYTFAQYLVLFCSHRAELMKRAEPSSLDNYQRGVYTTLDLSYKAIPQASRDFLHFISFFRYTNIPLAALAAAASTRFADTESYFPRPESHREVISALNKLLCPSGHWDELQVQESIRTLRSFSLVSATIIEDSVFLQLHPLVQSWCRDMNPPSKPYRPMMVQALSSCSKAVHYRLYRYLTPHILDMLEQIATRNLHVNDLMASGKVLNDQGNGRKAAELFEVAVEFMKSAPESGEEETLKVISWLASTYHKEGRWSETETLEVEILEQRGRILGTNDPETLTAASNLAVTYQKQGRWSEAEKLEDDVLEQRRKILGALHPYTLASAANLACTYGHQGRWGEAEKMQLQILEHHSNVMGKEHPESIFAAENLAGTYHSQGRWVEAETLQLTVQETRMRILGKDHPDTIRAAEMLARTYTSQGRWSEAEALQLEVRKQRTRIMGLEHPDTLRAVVNLAATYSSQGRWSESEELELQVLEENRRVQGREHPDTITIAANLAVTYWKQGKYDKAETLQLGALEQRKRVLGSQHPDTIGTEESLAATYYSQGKWSEAERLQLGVMRQRTRALGLDHPKTIKAAANLATTYCSQGHWNLSEALQVEVLRQQTKILGMDHPDAINAAANLAGTYSAQGRCAHAERLERDVLERRKRIQGEEHPDTMLAAANLAATYQGEGRHQEAMKLGEKVLEQRRRILGMEHPETIRTAANLAVSYWEQGRRSEAGRLELEVLELRKRVLGNEHPDTILAAVNLAITYASQGHGEQACGLLAPAVQLSLTVLGPRHPDTQRYIRHLRFVYEKLGRLAEVREIGGLLS